MDNWDRVAGACAAVGCVFYLIASLIFWLLLAKRHIGRPPPFDGIDVVADRAVAWSALALQFGAISALALQWKEWHQLDWLLALTSLAVAGAGFNSVRQMTWRKFGERVWLIYLATVLAVGVAFYLLV